MTEHDDRRFALEAIAYGDDPRISPSDRMKALELLDALPGRGTAGGAAMTVLAAQVAELSGDALDKELEGFMNPGWQDPPPPPPGSEKDIEEKVESRFRRAIKLWAKANGVRLEPNRTEPGRVAAQSPAEPVTSARPATEDEEKQRRAKVIQLDTGEVLDFGAPMTSSQHAIAQSKLARQEERNRIREEKRKRHPFGRHIPPGHDPAVWDRTFR